MLYAIRLMAFRTRLFSGCWACALDFSFPRCYTSRGEYVTDLWFLVTSRARGKGTTMSRSLPYSPPGPGSRPALLAVSLIIGVVGPLLFIVVFLLEGATRSGYDPVRYPVSSLSIGTRGWIQAANFLMVGLSL